MAAQVALRLRRVLLGAAAFAALAAAWRLQRLPAADDAPAAPAATAAAPAQEQGQETDPLGANAGCYVCHITFVKEELAKVHLKEKIGCIKCHGLSDKHANDENVGATKPDVVFARSAIEKNCAVCHEGHDASAKAVVARFVERGLPPAAAPVCTECHGLHKIERPAETP